jgi:hypothetical protein
MALSDYRPTAHGYTGKSARWRVRGRRYESRGQAYNDAGDRTPTLFAKPVKKHSGGI